MKLISFRSSCPAQLKRSNLSAWVVLQLWLHWCCFKSIFMRWHCAHWQPGLYACWSLCAQLDWGASHCYMHISNNTTNLKRLRPRRYMPSRLQNLAFRSSLTVRSSDFMTVRFSDMWKYIKYLWGATWAILSKPIEDIKTDPIMLLLRFFTSCWQTSMLVYHINHPYRHSPPSWLWLHFSVYRFDWHWRWQNFSNG